MNLDQFYYKLKNPNLLDSSDVTSLKDLSEKHPYSQVFSLLYLKALSVNKDLHFETEVENFAYKISDRVKLYHLLQEQSHTSPSEIQENEVTQPIIVDLEEEIKVESPKIIENPIVEELPPLEMEKEVPIEEINIDLVSEHLEPTEELPKEEEKAKHSDLDQEFLSNILASSYVLDQEVNEIKIEVQEKEIETKIDLQESRSFTSWLKISENKPEEKNLSNLKVESNKLIEKFILEEPERIKPKTEFYSAPKKAKESVDDSNLIYSETLANIYAMQGNYPKAIQAFNNLILTIPEKKLYFAKKIEELTKKINT